MSKFSGLLLAMPAYQGVMSRTVMSLWNTRAAFMEHGIKCDLAMKSGSALVGDARNQLTAGFLTVGAENFSHMLFVDSDLEWQADEALRFVLRVLMSDAQMACGTYRKKHVDLTNKSYAVNFDQATLSAPVINEHGLLKVRMAPGGWLCIRRDALEQMMAAYPELKIDEDESVPEECQEWHYDFFGQTRTDDNLRLSEDLSFCYRWEKLGGDLWLDPDLKLDHWGFYVWKHDLVGDGIFSLADSEGSSAA